MTQKGDIFSYFIQVYKLFRCFTLVIFAEERENRHQLKCVQCTVYTCSQISKYFILKSFGNFMRNRETIFEITFFFLNVCQYLIFSGQIKFCNAKLK